MSLPVRVQFEGKRNPNNSKGWCYTLMGFRYPKKGEFYLSGALVMAYRAPNDLTSSFHVVEPLAD